MYAAVFQYINRKRQLPFFCCKLKTDAKFCLLSANGKRKVCFPCSANDE